MRARRVIVAVPLAIAGQIDYQPTLPLDRMFLNQRMPSGAIVKISVVYDEPFWRADGLSGQTASPGSMASLTIDACTDTGTPGGMISHAPTGVLTEFGYALREPCGRIHWAWTESSAVMCRWVDGAIRSGERAAEEMLARETTAATEPV